MKNEIYSGEVLAFFSGKGTSSFDVVTEEELERMVWKGSEIGIFVRAATNAEIAKWKGEKEIEKEPINWGNV